MGILYIRQRSAVSEIKPIYTEGTLGGLSNPNLELNGRCTVNDVSLL